MKRHASACEAGAPGITLVAEDRERVDVVVAAGGQPAPPGSAVVLLLTEDLQAAARLDWQRRQGWGVLNPEAGSDVLSAAVRAVHEGLVVLGPEFSPAGLHYRAAGSSEAAAEGATRLTARERKVLALLARGLSNKQIGWELAISERTVKYHVSAIYNRLGAASRTEALRRGIEEGLLSL